MKINFPRECFYVNTNFFLSKHIIIKKIKRKNESEEIAMMGKTKNLNNTSKRWRIKVSC